MSDNTRRSYICRKKYMNNSSERIKKTLEFIKSKGKLKLSEQELQKEAEKHARSIEATCWSPHMHLSSYDYQHITDAKTRELCQALLQQYIPGLIDQIKPDLCVSPTSLPQRSGFPIPIAYDRLATPRSFPIPIVPSSAPSKGCFLPNINIPDFERNLPADFLYSGCNLQHDPFRDIFCETLGQPPSLDFDSGISYNFAIGDVDIETPLNHNDDIFKT